MLSNSAANVKRRCREKAEKRGNDRTHRKTKFHCGRISGSQKETERGKEEPNRCRPGRSFHLRSASSGWPSEPPTTRSASSTRAVCREVCRVSICYHHTAARAATDKAGTSRSNEKPFFDFEPLPRELPNNKVASPSLPTSSSSSSSHLKPPSKKARSGPSLLLEALTGRRASYRFGAENREWAPSQRAGQ